MPPRKPAGVSFESFVERQIREAQERGDFDNLPGKGKPLPGLDQPHDEMWWVKTLVEREKLSVLPPSLELKRRVEQGLERAMELGNETGVRRAVKLLNAEIARQNRYASQGPPTSISTLNADQIVAKWRRAGKRSR